MVDEDRRERWLTAEELHRLELALGRLSDSALRLAANQHGNILQSAAGEKRPPLQVKSQTA